MSREEWRPGECALHPGHHEWTRLFDVPKYPSPVRVCQDCYHVLVGWYAATVAAEFPLK